MTEPQIIKTPEGGELVVLTRSEYDSLLAALAEAEEELADIAVLDQRKSELETGATTALPEAVSALLLSGSTRLSAIWRWRELSLDELARSSGIDAAMLTAFETGARTADRGEAERIAKALDVPLLWIA